MVQPPAKQHRDVAGPEEAGGGGTGTLTSCAGAVTKRNATTTSKLLKPTWEANSQWFYKWHQLLSLIKYQAYVTFPSSQRNTPRGLNRHRRGARQTQGKNILVLITILNNLAFVL